MLLPVLQTRLKPPGLPDNILSRNKLLKKLNEWKDTRLILLSAPAGYGKTTLAGQWLKMQEKTFFWLSLDPIQRDSRIFMQYLISALGGCYEIFNKPAWHIPQLQADWSVQYLLTNLINELSILQDGFILMFDDYHLIETDENNEILSFLLENLPRSFSIMISSRAEPNLPLARMRAGGELAEIHLEDLQFDKNEAENLIRENTAGAVTGEEIIRIHTENEGWITGIRLAVLSLNRKSPGRRNFVNDYLFEEILEKENERLVSFLYKISILTYFNASLCDTLLQDAEQHSKEIIKELIDKNLFIKEIESEGDWYRLHPMFLEVLISTRDCELKALHIRAAEWFYARKQYNESFHHFIESEDYSLTISYLEKCWPLIEQEFIFLPWLKWAEAIPEQEKNKHPLFMCQTAWAQLDLGQLKQAEISLTMVERFLPQAPADNSIEIQLFSARAYLSFIRRELDETIKNARRMESITGADDIFYLMQAKSYIALADWLRGNLEKAYTAFISFRDEMFAMGVPAFAMGSYLALIQIRIQQQRFADAKELFAEAESIEDSQDSNLDKIKASQHLKAAMLYFEIGDSESMNSHLAISDKLTESDSLVDYHYQRRQFQALIYELHNKWDKALNELNNAAHLFIQTPAIDDISIEEQRIRILIRMGKKTSAKKALQNITIVKDSSPCFQNESGLLIKIRYTLAFQNEPEQLSAAIEQLNQLLDSAHSNRRMKSIVEILILSASLNYRLEKSDDAYNILLELLNMVDEYGCVQIFLLEKDLLAPLFDDFALRLKPLEAYQNIMDRITGHKKKNEILSSRELEVLQLMANGMTNKSIGESLFVAETTIKGHNQRIFQKLNVAKRTEAIAKARRMGLID